MGEGGVEYFDFGEPNHSHVMASLFLNNPYNYHFHRKLGKTKKYVDAYVSEWFSVIDRQIFSSEKEVFFISAEDVCTFTEPELVRMRDFLQKYFLSIKIICYLRSPVAFMQSLFQQRLKGGVAELKPERLYSSYRNLVEKFVKVFGVEHSTFVQFSKESLIDGDVVADVASRINEDKNNIKVKRANEGLSAEAAAVLFVYLRFSAPNVMDREAYKRSKKLVALLKGFGENKLLFGEKYYSFVEHERCHDLKWLKKHVGCTMDEKFVAKKNTVIVNSAEDLVCYCKSVYPDFIRHLAENNKGNVKVIDVVRAVDAFC